MTSTEAADRKTRDDGFMPVLWTDSEPDRLIRDRTEVPIFAPLLEFRSPSPQFPHGGWIGELPKWPFERPQPQGLNALIGEVGLQVLVVYPAAYPMVPPTLYPLTPEPTIMEQTQSAWHVAPGGSLCLLQSDGGWQPQASMTELLAKASGWRVEYALMKAGLIGEMSINGIVSDSSYDHLVADDLPRVEACTAPSEGP